MMGIKDMNHEFQMILDKLERIEEKLDALFELAERHERGSAEERR